MKALIITITIFLSLFAKAEIVVRHPDVSEEAYLASLSPGSQTVVEHLESQLPLIADEKRLVQKFERAQNLFLSTDLTAAKVAFIEITEEAFRADWTETQRKAILISFLRVAQLSTDLQAAQSYLTRAADFAADLNFDETLFPPPLVSEYKEALAHEKSKSQQIDLKDKFPQHDLILIDGKRVAQEQIHSYEVLPGQHRVTALSNSHQAFTQELTASQLNLIKADVPSYALGTCEEPALSGYQSLNSEQVRVVFTPKCARTYTGTAWLTSDTGRKIPKDYSSLQPNNFATTSTPQPVLTKKKLMLIGLGVGLVVTSVLLIKKSQQQREEIVPVNRQGF